MNRKRPVRSRPQRDPALYEYEPFRVYSPGWGPGGALPTTSDPVRDIARYGTVKGTVLA